jgi:hypothetical protein
LRMERRTPVRHDAGTPEAEYRAELGFGAPVLGESLSQETHAQLCRETLSKHFVEVSLKMA